MAAVSNFVFLKKVDIMFDVFIMFENIKDNQNLR